MDGAVLAQNMGRFLSRCCSFMENGVPKRSEKNRGVGGYSGRGAGWGIFESQSPSFEFYSILRHHEKFAGRRSGVEIGGNDV